MIIYFDGGCKPNPGAMEIAVVSDCDTVKFHAHTGYGTNNQAEWAGFIKAVAFACAMYLEAARPITIKGDSKLVVEQANGKWKVKHPDIQPLYAKYLKIIASVPKNSIKVEWIGRDFNLAGIYIEEINK